MHAAFRFSTLALLVAAASPSAALAADPAGASLDLRYRYEHVDQAGIAHQADAHTLRARVGYLSPSWHGWSARAEADAVLALDERHHNDTRNGRRAYPVVADPGGAEINQALLRHDGRYGSTTFGRQRMVLGNQRFVGGSAWRQNEQTYDGVRLQWTPATSLALDYAWIGGINTIFGPADSAASNRANPADIDGDSHLLQMRWQVAPVLAASAYHHRLRLDDIAVSAAAPLGTLSSRTSGLRLEGRAGAWSYAAEHARQRELRGNPWRLDSRYALAELGYTLHGVALKAGYESLGGGTGPGNHAFQTPLATRHQFQGWADVFLTTPASGIVDRYVGATLPLKGGSLQAWFHTFAPERGGGDYGDEIDLSYARPIPGVAGLDGLVKLARYRSDDPARTADTDKLWLQLHYAY
ncbi:alginate export family protein [Xanthomonas sp. XNM01]|uniref:alginate export family protein n=1 Tax=Xanthomonas sp. XNM01 TaxID=2769289 RepID=UPI001782FC36|nr:alginate export family protein [Xanthomonas sp. XNM01]MBD9367129.1 alginate export family protein [Xanthomonas sp. XNM01]